MKKSHRIWELDALRGIAIIMMVFFHMVFDLRTFFGITQINYHEGFWYYEGRVSAIIFIVLVGVVSAIIHQKEEHTVALQKNSYRGLRLIGFGLIITLITFIFARQDTIWFGILHFLGLSILISIPLLRFKWFNVFLAFILFGVAYPLGQIYTESYLGLIFGIYPPHFSSFDHYALTPWLGYVLIGIALGNWLYRDGRPLIRKAPGKVAEGLMEAGRNSLWIYLFHQPLLLGILWLHFRLIS